jgi:hypothetical protein
MEATVVIGDDITDAKIARSPAARLEESRKWRDEILTRIEPANVGGASGRAVMVGQRVDPEDIYEEMAEQVYVMGSRKGQPVWHFHTQPTVVDWDTQKVTWPARWSWEEVEVVYARVGEQTFETMYQQNPRPSGSTSVKPEWIEACKDSSRVLGDGVPKGGMLPVARVVAIDPSPSEWNALLVADVSNTKGDWACMLIDSRKWKGRGPEFKAEVERAIELYSPDYLVVEESTFFKWFSEDVWFENLAKKIRVIKHHTGVNKNDLELGADSLASDFEMSRISIPWGDEAARAAFQHLVNEALGWPLSKVYDQFMALWFIKWNRKLFKVRGAKADHFFGIGIKHQLNASGRAMAAERKRDKKAERLRRYGIPA